MNTTRPTYSIKQLAPGSFDVLLSGNLVAALTREVGGAGDDWRIDLLTEAPPSEYPPPFEAQSHTFISQQAALEWLGIRRDLAQLCPAPVRKSTRTAPRLRTNPSVSERYRLRLLSERSRFYTNTTGINSLILRGFIAPTGQVDADGRIEWVITETGRAALAEIEP